MIKKTNIKAEIGYQLKHRRTRPELQLHDETWNRDIIRTSLKWKREEGYDELGYLPPKVLPGVAFL